MCNWCNKETRTVPQCSGVTVPMICEDCGTKIEDLDWRQLRHRLDKAEGRNTRTPTRQECITRLLNRSRVI